MANWEDCTGFRLDTEASICQPEYPIPMQTLCVHVRVPPGRPKASPFRPAGCHDICNKNPTLVHLIRPPPKIGPVQMIYGRIVPRCSPEITDLAGRITFLKEPDL